MKQKLLTIGQLAQLTHTHIKALRYYESIGILLPTMIDATNGYRYYTPSNILYVKVIKLCAENDLPLKKIHDFIHQAKNEIELEDLIRYATTLVQDKLRLAQEQLDFLQTIQDEIHVSEQIHHHGSVTIEAPETVFWCVPFNDTILSFDYFAAIREELCAITNAGYHYLNRTGLLYLFTNGIPSCLLAIEVETSTRDISDIHSVQSVLYCLPKRCVAIEHIEVHEIPNIIEDRQNRHPILILETFEKQYKLDKTHVEIQFIQS